MCLRHFKFEWAVFNFEHFTFVMCFVMDCQRGSLLGSNTLGTNVLELQFVICWQTMIKTLSLDLGLLKVYLLVKLESSDCRNSNSAQACLMCRILCFSPSIKGKTLDTF